MNGLVTPQQIRSAEKVLGLGTWAITFGAVLYSMLTVTPLMAEHTPEAWDWTAPILPMVVDAAVVIVVRMDGILARLGGDGGRWPVVLRWMTGVATVLLNVGESALKRDAVGVAVHAVAPLLLIVTAETSLAYRRAIARAVAAREAHERTEREERRRLAEQAQEKARAEQKAAAVEAARLAREADDRRRERDREQREHDLVMLRENLAAQERRDAAEREAKAKKDADDRAAKELRERLVSEREQREREREQQRLAALQAQRDALLSGPPAVEKLPEGEACAVVWAAAREGLPQRRVAELTGWSTGWVAARYREAASTQGHPAAADTTPLAA
ncbi:hypothetical protein [Kitasatospora griseola]|uniref:hypothetical protein n=1 Tax=Kitasatospora griseola TaxID=2064 RepID=UPI0005C7911A|nr:hypothetical protein [Kitasatospora griseola]